MHKTIVGALRNIGRKEGELLDDKPIHLKSYEVHAEDNNHAENEEIQRIFQDDLERIKPSKSQSNHRLVWLAIVTCLILIAGLFVGLLILSRKMGHGCGCSEESGPQRLKYQPPRGISSEENGTNITDLIEKFHYDLKDKAAMDGMKNDLAKLNRTITGIENLKYQLIDVKAALNGTKKGLAELNSTVVTIENFNSDLNDMKAAVDGTKNDLAKLNRTLTEVENLNSDFIDVKAALDGTKNDLAELNSTVVTGRDKPSAHLESFSSPLVKTYEANTVLKDWSNNTRYSHLTGGMTYHDGSLTVPTPGRYYIYAQIYYHVPGRVLILVNNRPITMIHPGIARGSHATQNTAVLFPLKAGDVISLRAGQRIQVYQDSVHTYFGAFLI